MADIEQQIKMVKEVMEHEANPLKVLDSEILDSLSSRFAKRFRGLFAELFAELIDTKPERYGELTGMVKQAVRHTKYSPSYLMKRKVMPALIETGLINWNGDKTDRIEWV